MQALLSRAELFRERIAILSEGSRYTYSQLIDQSAMVAAHLLEGQRDLHESRIAFLIDPSFAYTAVQWGIWQAGGIAVPLCVLHPLDSIRYVLQDAEIGQVVVSQAHLAFLSPVLDELGIRVLEYESLDATIQIADAAPIEENRKAMILYTSGTTSSPKGVVTTHGTIRFQIKSLVDVWGWSEDDHILNILPLHHVHGIINVMSCALWSGACCEFLPKFDVQQVWDIFRTERLSLFMAVPTIYYKLIQYWQSQPVAVQQAMSASCQSFRLMVSGSAALPVPVLEQWEQISGQRLLERYGMTEVGMALSNPYQAERRPGHVGQPLPGVQIRLADSFDQELASGEQGEIQIKGPNVFLEYWNKPDATQSSFTADGWFRSGDIAVVSDGYYQILGRSSIDIIKSGGYKVSALEIESVLLSHPDVLQAGVLGVPDDEWGELIVAALVSRTKQPDLKSIERLVSEKLPSYKKPRRYLMVDDLPKNTIGKVTKHKLKSLFILDQ